MAYPTTLDDNSTLPVETTTTPLSTNHVTNHTAMRTAIIAIETLLGITASAVTGTVNYILGEITGSDKAVGKTATQTMTNKTLTSPKITVGSDAVGDLHYTSNVDGTQSRIPIGSDNQILKLNGSTINWENEAATVDASTTVKGVVEAATAAEVTAGTATGGTGAVLAVTPDALASSTPVFNGSGLTNVNIFTAVHYDVRPGLSATTKNYNTNTLMYLSKLTVTGKITVNKVSFNVTAVGTSGTMDVTCYSKSGGTQLFSVTTGTISGAGVVTTDVSSVVLTPGEYYIGINPNTTAAITIDSWNNFAVDTVTGKASPVGGYTITASTPPATITPTSISTDVYPMLRIDN